MRDVVRRCFVAFTAPLEGVTHHMYLDVKGLVTTGIGNLVDPMTSALGLPFRRPNRTMATRDEIAAEWQRLKADPNAARMGHRYAARICQLRLDDQAIENLVAARLEANDAYIRERFADWEDWPADAQLAVHSLCWAMGPHFFPRFPRLDAALRSCDWITASNECRMQTHDNPGVAPRNDANRLLFRNAAAVVASGFDMPALSPEVLYWPGDLERPVGKDDPTLPEFPDFAIVHPPVPLPLDSTELDEDDEPPSAA